ncbi:MAG: 2-hydroxyglutaryl-CoA dehydratase [Erysipelotrichaceae bacterium]|nr:2-hydroxyglutaryl-CoA dehydratase [Erysipelotrichaceae bacterium]
MSNEPVFTKENAKDYTILVPMMCPIHFELLKSILTNCGYNIEILSNVGPSVVETGLKYVHNDTCYPALLVIGQMIDALKSGKYDTHKVALIITQTGGGCRASNYIYLLKKALKKANLDYIPVLSMSTDILKRSSSFKINLNDFRKMMISVIYGDLLMDLSNQTKPYEINMGDTAEVLSKWITDLSSQFCINKGLSKKEMRNNFRKITEDFANIPIQRTPKVKVGIVGEIYVKYSPLGNNSLEEFLATQDCEVKVPGVMGFMLYSIYNSVMDHKYYGGSKLKVNIFKLVYKILTDYEEMMIESVKKYSDFLVPTPFDEVIHKAEKVIDLGIKMGEGWLLTGEMADLCEIGFHNIICTQPFGCLPNHIVGKGMIRKLREIYPNANVVPIDYDPSATQVNQENRIKLMLSVAKEEFENGLVA